MLPSLFVALSLALAPAPEVVEKVAEKAEAEGHRELQFKFGDTSNGYGCASWCVDRSQCSTLQCMGCNPMCDKQINVCQPWCTAWTCPRGDTKGVKQFRDDCSGCYVCKNRAPGTVDPASLCALTTWPLVSGFPSPAQCDAWIYRHGCSATFPTACPGKPLPTNLLATNTLAQACPTACTGR